MVRRQDPLAHLQIRDLFLTNIEIRESPARRPTRQLQPTTIAKKSAIFIMSDNEENASSEGENVEVYHALPKDVVEEIGSIKLFNKWSYEDVEIRDISLT